ncbi:MAG: VOC family protein [Pseudomonadota bacterium]
MPIGAFSMSLSVKDLAASLAFYETLGFEAVGDFSDQGWMILKNGDHMIGLFKGMFEGNLMTFNPGWDQNAEAVDPFVPAADIRAKLEAAGLDVKDAQGGDPAKSFVVTDPDGNVVLVDQHR